MGKTPKVFISYSWDSEEHKQWVLNLAKKLIEEYHVEVILDQYELSAGKNMTQFMERSVEIADKVLMILTPNYKTKADNREKGVGFEYSIISQRLYEQQIEDVKFIPILRKGDLKESAPIYISTLIAHLMNNDMRFESDLLSLARLIHDKPEIEKPELGPMPNFNELGIEKDPVIEMAKKLSDQINLDKRKQEYLSSQEGLMEAVKQFNYLLNELDKKAQYYNQTTEFHFSIASRLIVTHPSFGQDPYGNLIGDRGICYHFYFNIDKGYIAVSEWNRPPKLPGENVFYFPGEEPKQITQGDFYYFAVDDNIKPKWRDADGNLLMIDDIIKKYFVMLMERIIQEKQKKN